MFCELKIWLVESPPKKSRQQVTVTPDSPATTAAMTMEQPSQCPIKQREIKFGSSASQEGFINHTNTFQPLNYTFSKRKCGEHNRMFQATWFKEFPWLHYIQGAK